MDLGSLLKTVAPWIGTALGGPLGGLAVDAATSALGLSDKSADGLKNALAGVTQEDILKLKQADQNFQETMQTLGFKQVTDLETIAASDRKDARALEVNTKSIMPALLSSFITIGFFGLLTGMMTGVLQYKDNQALMLMLGSFATAFTGVVAYWFGTTASSQAKTDIIARSPPVQINASS
jgi:hypothetical protein